MQTEAQRNREKRELEERVSHRRALLEQKVSSKQILILSVFSLFIDPLAKLILFLLQFLLIFLDGS